MNVEVWKYENVKMVELWNGGMQKHFHILSFHHPTISILSHSHITLIPNPHCPLRPPRRFCYTIGTYPTG